MQKLAFYFEIEAGQHTEFAERPDIRALIPACKIIETYIRRKTDVPASVFIMPREDNYPVILLTPDHEHKVDRLKDVLAETRIAYERYPGITMSDILSVLEPQGNRPHGVVLQASKDIVNCLARSLDKLMAPNEVPALRL